MRRALREHPVRGQAGLLLVASLVVAAVLAWPGGGDGRERAEPELAAMVSVPDLWVARLTLRRHEAVLGDMRVVRVHGRGRRPGRYALRARYRGHGRNGYSRVVLPVRWRPGQEVRYGASFYLPRGFYDAMEGEVDLLRFDNYPIDPAHNDRGGVVIHHQDRRAWLVRQRLGYEQVGLGGPFELPEGRWFRLEVRQRLSRGATRNAVYVDGRRVAFSRQGNSYGRVIRRLRVGIVAIASGAQRRPLTVYFDAPSWRVVRR